MSRSLRVPKRPPRHPSLWGKVGLNVGTPSYFDGQYTSSDVFSTAMLPINPATLQTTLSANHTSGDGILKLANPTWPSPNSLPGTVVGNISIQSRGTSTTLTNTTAYTVVGTGLLFLQTPTNDQNLSSGNIVDNISAGSWANTTWSALAADWIDTGRDTGYPTGLVAGQQIQSRIGDARRIPAGTYTLQGRGSGRLNLNGPYFDGTTITSTNITFTNGVPSPATITFTKETGAGVNVLFQSTGSDPANPLRDVRLVMPDRAGMNDGFVAAFSANSGNASFFQFHPAFKDHLKPASCLRFMDWGATNNSTVQAWADRALQGQRIGLAQARGIPYEVMLQLCNEQGADCWLNIPHAATDDFVTQLASLCAANLSVNRKLYVEYSNELWNTQFSQWAYSINRGLANFSPHAVTSITYSSGTGKCTVAKTAHGYSNGNTIQMGGATDANFNGAYPVTVIDANTLTYTPASAPAGATAVAEAMGFLHAYITSETTVRTISSMTFDITSSTARVTVTTSAVHGLATNDMVYVDNASDSGFTGLQRITFISTTSFRFDFTQQGGTRTIPAATGATTTAGATAGQTMRMVWVGSDQAASGNRLNNGDQNLKWRGRRSAQIHAIFEAAFASRLLKLAAVIGHQAAGNSTGNNALLMNQYLADIGGSLPAGPDHCWAFAPYFGSAGGSDAAVLGTVKVPTALSFAAGQVTATIAAHGYIAGDIVGIFNITDDAYNGLYPVDSVVDANTVKYTPVGTPAGSTAALYSTPGRMTVKNPPHMRELISVSAPSGGVCTAVSYNHGFASGDKVYLSNMKYQEYQTTVSVTVVDAHTFTFPTASALTPVAVSSQGRMWALRYGGVDKVMDDAEAHLTATVPGWVANHAGYAATWGMCLVCYECGTQVVPLLANQNFVPVADAYVAANDDSRFGRLCETYLDTLAAGGVTLANWYNNVFPPSKVGVWGVLKYDGQDPTTSPKWRALARRAG
jgi:hypothetical protein